MNTTPAVETIVVEEVGEKGGIKVNGQWYQVSKFSAFKDFKAGESYTVEVEEYEYNGFLGKRIRRVMPK